MNRRSWHCGLAWAGVLLAGTGKIHAQNGAVPPALPPASQPAAGAAPLTPYIDPAFGFELQIPAGWVYDHTRFTEGRTYRGRDYFRDFKDTVGILQGRSPDGHRALQINVFRNFALKEFSDWAVSFGNAIATSLRTQSGEWVTRRVPPREAIVLTYTTQLGASLVRTHYLCVPFDPTTIWVLVYSGTVADDAESQVLYHEFEQITDSLRVLYDPQQIERLTPAYDRGRALLERIRDQGSGIQLDGQIHYYEISEQGKPVGYLSRQYLREEFSFGERNPRARAAREGLRVRERSWRFGADGTAWHTRLDLFSSFDRRSEHVEDWQRQVPPPGAVDPRALLRVQQVTREADVLLASFWTRIGEEGDPLSTPTPKPRSVGPVYLDQAWARLLPGLLLGYSEEQHAVAVFNREVRALLVHVITPKGETRIDGYSEPVWVFEVREGFVDLPTRLYTDDRGLLVRAETGPVLLRMVSVDYIEKTYGPQREAARERGGVPRD